VCALFALGSSLMIAAWLTGSDVSSFASAALPANPDNLTFEDRFLPVPTAKGDALAVKRPALAMAEPETTATAATTSTTAAIATAREALTQRWMPQEFRTTITADEEPQAAPAKPAVATAAIPMPRSRPAAADMMVSTQALAQPGSALALADATPQAPLPQQPAERSAFQKFSDMMKAKVAVASLGLGKAPDLAALGYDNETAVYDISAHAVYLPNGSVWEAHSGMGNMRDDTDHVLVPNTGATPPAMYSLRPREASFHGVAALRMTPAEGSDIGGRSGLLIHSYMLGPNGDSNGCISIRDFDRFRKAYDEGQFNHIAVVPSVKAIILAQQTTD
jgi:hypothetical protein